LEENLFLMLPDIRSL